ncbi:adenine-specific methyltransferase EcoRI family protein [uncultured Ruminococcus sp.]|uniref:adenine-specific methyltransferase EcoRI family protein n=1 Tax=uncultured Ruminococcus sp. TaxID=165186 RepID=UPI00292E93D9|nr:adenine-specific methyltransferase EcoRI family protein [uncultured Ruminococcus sp.]
MAGNSNLSLAKNAKKDEFYTQYGDIEAEMNAYVEFNPDVFRDKVILLPCDDPEWSNFTKYFANNFDRFGLKKLISTSYAKGVGNLQLTLFEMESPFYDKELHDTHGKLFTLTRDKDHSGNIDTDDIIFSGYLKGDGDFRSDEVSKLRDEADIIITNPPFSLFREFLSWIIEGNKKFIIVANQNAITYKEVFPLLKNNQMWLGQGFKSNVGYFSAPTYEDYATAGQHKDGFIRVSGVMWFTNIDLGKRHIDFEMDTLEHNLKYNKKLRKKFEGEYGKIEYPCYDNYDAIEVPFTECIPSDYKGVMGVPITFMDKYNPEQFEIVGMCENEDLYQMKTKKYTTQECKERYYELFGKEGTYDLNASGVIQGKKVYQRILIRLKKG